MKKIDVIILFVCLLIGCSNSKQTIKPKGVIKIDDIAFQYTREGKGEPVVVIGSSVYYPKSFSKSLKERFEMIYVDMRHFIPSYNPSDKKSINLTTWADDLETIRQQLGLKKITVIGHSIHAQIALEYATKYSQNVKRMALIGGVPYNFSEFGEMTEKYWEEEADSKRKRVFETKMINADSILSETPIESLFAVGYDLRGALYWLNPEYDASNLLAELKSSQKAFDILVGSLPSKEEVKEKLQQLTMPTALILGKYDFAIPYMAWEPIIQDTKVDYYLMENASHNPFTEEVSRKDFDNIFLNWVSKN